MSEEDKDSKTFDPSQKKLKDAREKGQVARSKEFSSFTTLILFIVLFYLGSPLVSDSMVEWFNGAFTFSKEELNDFGLFKQKIFGLFLDAFVYIIFILCVLCLGSVLGNLAIGGWVFSSKGAMPKFNKVNPIEGIKRMFSKKTLVELIKTVLKVILIAGVGYFVLSLYTAELQNMTFLEIDHIGKFSLDMAALFFTLLVLSLLIVVVIDAPFQIFQHKEKLKMSLKEVKDENKETEGDPHQKGYMRRKQREISSMAMMQSVPDADVIVTNPTHYSVALKYEGGDEAPMVVASGVNLIALKIREIAKEHQVTVLESPALARSLYKHVDVGDRVPESLFNAVGKIIGFITRLDELTHEQRKQSERLIEKINVPRDMQYNGD